MIDHDKTVERMGGVEAGEDGGRVGDGGWERGEGVGDREGSEGTGKLGGRGEGDGGVVLGVEDVEVGEETEVGSVAA